MTIAAVCPHCDSEFQLQPDLVGKTIRCPNFDCREPFEVKSKAIAEIPKPVAPPPLPPPPSTKPATSNISDFLPVLDAVPSQPYERVEKETFKPVLEAEAMPKMAAPIPTAKLLPTKDLPVAKLLNDVPTARLLPPPAPIAATTPVVEAPKVVSWSEDLGTPEPPSAPAETKPTTSDEPPQESLLDDPMLRRRRSRSIPQVVLVSLILLTIVSILGTVGWVFIVNRDTEAKLSEDAKQAYDSGNYSGAATIYERLATEYTQSQDVPKYQFLKTLSGLRGTVAAVTAKESPQPGMKAFQDFVKESGNSPFAKADDKNFGGDLFIAGRQVIDNLIAFAESQTAEFKADRTQLKPLEQSEAAVDDARKLFPTLQPFRTKENAPLEAQTASLDKIAAMNSFERHRLAVLAPFRSLPEEPTDEGIEKFEQTLRREKLDSDREAQDIVTKAKTRLKELIVSTAVNIPATPAPVSTDVSMALVSQVERPPTAPNPRKDERSDTILAVARGVLYAFDTAQGAPLWFARIGPPNLLAELPVRTTLGEGGLDAVIVPGMTGDQPSITCRNLTNGEPVWHQPLEAGVAGRPIPYRDRVFVALKDPLGTIAEFDLLTGTRVAQFQLRQPVGPGMALDQLGGRLYVSANARRVFVLDVGRRDRDGRRLPPKCVRILATDHAPDGLLCEPIPVGVSATGNEQRFLIVCQKVDPNTMKLRSFALPEVTGEADLNDVLLSPVSELTAAGWLSFPPQTDGERISFVTDQGQLALYGINQQGNLDKALFSLPMPESNAKGKTTPGQVVFADEDGFWVVVDGQLNRYRSSLQVGAGFSLAMVGSTVPVGDPLHRPQVARDRVTAAVVYRNPVTFGNRVICFDLRNGIVRWQRQLGAISPASNTSLADGSLVAVDDDGGIFHIPSNSFDGNTKIASDNWNVGAAPIRPTGRSYLTTTIDGQSTIVMSSERRDQANILRVRTVAGGPIGRDHAINFEHKIVGTPIAFEDGLLVPMSDGIIYRYDPTAGKLLAGPTWRKQDQSADAVCHLGRGAKAMSFLATDGANGVSQWTWTEKTEKSWAASFQKGWEAVGPIIQPPLVIGESLLLADETGLSSFPASAPGEPLLRWRDFKNIKSLTITGNRVTVLSNGVATIDPANEKPVWTWTPEPNRAEPIGMRVTDKRIIVTDGDSQVLALDPATGRVLVSVSPNRVGLLPADSQPALPLKGGRLVLPLADGTAVILLAGE